MNTFKLDKRLIGNKFKPLIVAEIESIMKENVESKKNG